MGAWTREELETIGAAEELQMSPRRPDGTVRKPVTIWVVRVAGDLYVRSYRGGNGAWFRAVQTSHEARISAGGIERDVTVANSENANDLVDEAYRTKYHQYPQYVEPMMTAEARGTTLKLVPRGTGR